MNFSEIYRHDRQGIIVLTLSIAIFIVFVFFLPHFLSTDNLVNLVRSVTLLGILAVAMGMIVIGRGIDLSLISVMAISTAWLLNMLNQQVSLAVALPLTLLAVVAIGMVNGLLIAYAEIPALFATLATGILIYGIGRSQLISQDVIYLPKSQHTIVELGEAALGPVPLEIVLFFVLAVLIALLLRFFKYGRYLYLMGDNLQAARNIGIPIRPLITLQYIVSALVAFIAGLVIVASLHSINTRIIHSTLLYDVILVVVVGGIGLSGGKGGMRNVIYGTLLIGLLINGLTILDISDLYQNLIKASFLLIALIIDGVINPRDEQTDQQGDI
ncbi:ABC transporter permease [Yersinia enterocolitica]|uniref:ABC transporter permease n=2 Tax=Yersinia TaxID=629 RepID=UPI0002E9D1F9|nr:ABC transporter permease [Yersinia enterocolitica]AKF38789.1 ABC transporter permease [Yersinia enterocolitica]ALG44630.1 ABC transporter permease [Yersinia enterocolitica]EKN3513694.1 ABC transporter permease [Yersinia enterocolitica]EKN3734353.1 ABC transporter permease [Yersinia enterocolitica]EKN3781493.1 ABC transporter permease [Yersinia enterocolitica]